MTDAKDYPVMEDFVSLTYSEALAPTLQRFGEHLIAGRIVGHQSPSGNVYVPGREYDPLTLEVTTEADEVEIADTGTVSGYTVITPVQYYGQKETEPFVVASVLLDGATNAIPMQRMVNMNLDDMRAGLKVRAVWKPASERSMAGLSNRWWGGLDCAIAGFEPTGAPDAGPDWIREHMF